MPSRKAHFWWSRDGTDIINVSERLPTAQVECGSVEYVEWGKNVEEAVAESGLSGSFGVGSSRFAPPRAYMGRVQEGETRIRLPPSSLDRSTPSRPRQHFAVCGRSMSLPRPRGQDSGLKRGDQRAQILGFHASAGTRFQFHSCNSTYCLGLVLSWALVCVQHLLSRPLSTICRPSLSFIISPAEVLSSTVQNCYPLVC